MNVLHVIWKKDQMQWLFLPDDVEETCRVRIPNHKRRGGNEVSYLKNPIPFPIVALGH